MLNNIWNILISPLKLIEGRGSYLKLKVIAFQLKMKCQTCQWIRHGILEEYKEYGIVEGESTLYIQGLSLNKWNKNMLSRILVNVKSLITQPVFLF